MRCRPTADPRNESEKSSVQQRPGSSTSSITQFKGSMPNPQSKAVGGPHGNLNDQVYSVYHGQPIIKPSSQMISVMGPKATTQLTPKRLSQKGMPPRPMRSPKQANSEMAGQSPKSELKADQVHSGSASTELHTGVHNNEKDTTSSGSNSQGYEESDRSILEIQASIQKELQDGPQNNPILMLRAFAKPAKSSTIIKQAFGGDKDTEDESSPVLGDIKVELASPARPEHEPSDNQRAIKGFFQPTVAQSRGVELMHRRQVPNGQPSQTSGNAQTLQTEAKRQLQTGPEQPQALRSIVPRSKDSAAKGVQQLK